MDNYAPSNAGATSGSDQGRPQGFFTTDNNPSPALTSQALGSAQHQSTTTAAERTNTFVAKNIASNPQYGSTSDQASIDAHIECQKEKLAAFNALFNQ